VTRRDVESYVLTRDDGIPSGMPSDGERLEPLSPLRRQIAAHMSESARSIPHAWVLHEADLTAIGRWLAVRRARAESGATDVKWTYLPFILHSVAAALAEDERVRALYSDQGIQYRREIGLGVAVAIPDGVIVPVIRDADRLSLDELRTAIERLARRAREGSLSLDELQGATFTVTNPGVFGSITGTPIIPRGQSAILCLGRIEKRVVVLDGDNDAIAVRRRAYLSLSFDHRVLDGEAAARFLDAVTRRIESLEFPRSS
jgi:pyruvate/2-oxoglutarate dehydrogenase complex dihydrolipoamide acyltransferase (E2) component